MSTVHILNSNLFEVEFWIFEVFFGSCIGCSLRASSRDRGLGRPTPEPESLLAGYIGCTCSRYIVYMYVSKQR